MALLEVKNLEVYYGVIQAIKGISFEVNEGEIVTLIGSNGAGKTTSFYMIVGLVPATEGKVFLDGADITEVPMYKRARMGIGYLPQEASVFRKLTVLTTPPGEDGVIHVTLDVAEESIQKPVIRCDESLYYDMLSAFCKSLRGSDADAAMAWFARLLYAGVDPRLIARRIIAHASEDVGLADPRALELAVAAYQACHFLGVPECNVHLTQAVTYLSLAPKSNAMEVAYNEAKKDCEIQLGRHGAGSIRRRCGKGRFRPRADPFAGYALRRSRAAGQRRTV